MYRERFYQFYVKLKYKKINIDFLHTYVDVAFSIQYNRAILLLGRNYIGNIDTGSPLFTTIYHNICTGKSNEVLVVDGISIHVYT